MGNLQWANLFLQDEKIANCAAGICQLPIEIAA